MGAMSAGEKSKRACWRKPTTEYLVALDWLVREPWGVVWYVKETDGERMKSLSLRLLLLCLRVKLAVCEL